MSTRPLTWILLLAAAGCGSSRAPARQGGGALAGTWSATFVLTQPEYGSGPNVGDSVSGEIRFPRPRPDSTIKALPGLHLKGIYSVDFGRLGFAVNKGWPENLAATGGNGDSALVVLNPQYSHGGVVMNGRKRDGLITGTWYHNTEGGAQGSFHMRRK